MKGGSVLRRQFVPIATAEYENPPWDAQPLPGTAKEVAALRQWLCGAPESGDLAVGGGLGGPEAFTEPFAELSDSPSLAQIEARLKHQPSGQRFRDGDAVVLYITGHGQIADRSHWLVLKQTEHGRPVSTALRTADVTGWLKETRPQHLLLLLDVCYGGWVEEEINGFKYRLPSGWIGFASASPDEPARAQALTRAVAEFLDELKTPVGQKYAGSELEFLLPDEFYRAIRQRLAREGQTVLRLFPNSSRDPHHCLLNPHYRPAPMVEVGQHRREVALSEADLLAHWDPRARGVGRADELGWFFTGREALMAELVARAAVRLAGHQRWLPA